MELRKTWDDRYGLLNHPYLHYGVVLLVNNNNVGEPTSWAASVDGPECTIIVSTFGFSFPVTLPPAAANPGKAFYIKRIDDTVAGGDVKIKAAIGDSIDGATDKILVAQYDALLVVSDGTTNWWIIGKVS